MSDLHKEICDGQRNAGELAALGIETDDHKIHRLRMSEPSEIRRLRWLLAMSYAGSRLYREDGEYSDPESGIDFRRDAIPEIERKMLAHAESRAVASNA